MCEQHNQDLQRDERGQALAVCMLYLYCPEIKPTSSCLHHSSCNHFDYLVLVQGENQCNMRAATINIPLLITIWILFFLYLQDRRYYKIVTNSGKTYLACLVRTRLAILLIKASFAHSGHFSRRITS
jgi:hypothetical protein